MQDETQLIEAARRGSREFAELEAAHRRLEDRLQDFLKLRYLTPEEEMEKKRLQKEKLLTKDRMAMIVRAYRQPHGQQRPAASTP